MTTKEINDLLLTVGSFCTFEMSLDLSSISAPDFALLQDAVITDGAVETLIAFSRDNASRVDIARVETQCWRTWEAMLRVESDKDRFARVFFQQLKLAVLVPRADVQRLEDFLVEHSKELPQGGVSIRWFADEVPGANIKRLENVLFEAPARIKATTNWCRDLAAFAAIKGADVSRIQAAIIASGDLYALCDLLTGSFNMNYRKPLGVDEGVVLDAIRNGIKDGNFKGVHPLDLICCYEKAKGIATRLGKEPIVNLGNVRRYLMSPTERDAEDKQELVMLSAKYAPGVTTVQ